jgi:hypothetical protein
MLRSDKIIGIYRLTGDLLNGIETTFQLERTVSEKNTCSNL